VMGATRWEKNGLAVSKAGYPGVDIGLGQILKPHSLSGVLSQSKVVLRVVQQVPNFLHVHLHERDLTTRTTRAEASCCHKASTWKRNAPRWLRRARYLDCELKLAVGRLNRIEHAVDDARDDAVVLTQSAK
jgi:hypothetical protein